MVSSIRKHPSFPACHLHGLPPQLVSDGSAFVVVVVETVDVDGVDLGRRG